MAARRMQAHFEARLKKTGAEVWELRKKRSDLGLTTRAMVERVHSHRKLETLMEKMANLNVRPAPKPDQPHHRLGYKVDTLLMAKRTSKRSALDLLNAMR